MFKTFARWIVPGVVVVLGGTALSTLATEGSVATDLQTRAAADLSSHGFDWAELQVRGQDAVLAGTTTDQPTAAAAKSVVASLFGIRTVATDIEIAPLAKPFTISASLDAGSVTLAGGVPNIAVRDQLVAIAKPSSDLLAVRSGAPERDKWQSGVHFALQKLQSLDEGKVELSDLTLRVSGRAKTERAYGEILASLQRDTPAGIALGDVTIAPPLATPYEWSARFDGNTIAISGYAPDENLVERFRVADSSGFPVATGIALASGAPADFARNTQLLLKNLIRLDHGTATIIDGHRTLTGAPPDARTAEIITDELKPSGTIVVLEPPNVKNYQLNATRNADGQLLFEGYAPDEATRERLSNLPGADVSRVSLGRNAPQYFQSALDFGVAALQKMSTGHFEVRGQAIGLNGTADTSANYKALLQLQKNGAPQGFEFVGFDITAPVADPFLWTADKRLSGAVDLSGYFPDEKTQSKVVAAVASLEADQTELASGAPNDFISSALTGLSLLNEVELGSLAFDGNNWSLSGQLANDAQIADLQAAFAAQGLDSAGWTLSLTGPEPVAVTPYIWSATRAADGAVTLSGNVASADLKRNLYLRSGDQPTDTSAVSVGAPDNFAASASAGLRALMQLDSGALKFDGTRWTLAGDADETVATDLLPELASDVDIAAWTVDISQLEAKPAPAPAKPYVWSASRDADGRVKLSGMVPTDSLKRFLAVRAGDESQNDLTIAADAPDHFSDDTLAALDALGQLDSGIVAFDGTAWSINGQATEAGRAGVDASLSAAATPAIDWTLNIKITPEIVAPQMEAKVDLPAESAEAKPIVKPVPSAPEIDQNYQFGASRDSDGNVNLTGTVPTAAARSYFGVISTASTQNLDIAPDAPEAFLRAAEVGLRTLMTLSNGTLSLKGGAWSLAGKAPNEVGAETARSNLAALPNAADWTVDIAAPTALENCRATVLDFSTQQSILFQSGAALISANSKAALDILAADLAMCPDTIVQIEGHTDDEGDASLNLALSVARAEAVVAALIERHVLAARLYAVGFGESQPIASNDTTAGRRQNRRIGVTILDQHY
ncbi:OmpA family protein [Devosia algicola]|uniref:OmpA family protein n=1 Tax=Devosia algicola TaxID=3026418 RepID=A0ABY7YNT0_9HYPH|nr:OmpA family protein [Devosia algicola]WDR02978.1 OmpA family protein [Devosia algicola]